MTNTTQIPEPAVKIKSTPVTFSEDGTTVFVPLPQEMWQPMENGLQCACAECRKGALSVWDTLVVPANADNELRKGAFGVHYTSMCHYPEISQKGRY